METGFPANADVGDDYVVTGKWVNAIESQINANRPIAGNNVSIESTVAGSIIDAKAGGETTTEVAGESWFWARITGLPTIIPNSHTVKHGLSLDLNTPRRPDHSPIDPQGEHYSEALEQAGWKFYYPFEEVYLVGARTYMKETEDQASYEVTDQPTSHPVEEDKRTGSAINMAEFHHKPIGGGDDQQPWVVYGVNIAGSYYPPAFNPIPVGCYFDITDELIKGQLYHPLSDLGGKQVMPVVRMREFTDPYGIKVYEFEREGSHDGGCAPVEVEE